MSLESFLGITITGDSSDAIGSLQALKQSLNGAAREAMDLETEAEQAADQVSDVGTAAAASTAKLGIFSGVVNTTTASLVGLGAAASGVVAGLGAIAGAGALVIGSGLAAFGEQAAEANREELETINSKISGLKELKETEEGLTGPQQERLELLKERREEVKKTTSITGALAEKLEPVKEAFVDAFTAAGEQFIPLIKDGLSVLPGLIRDLGEAFKNADLSNLITLLRNLGGFIAENAVPAFKSFLSFADDAAGVFTRIGDVLTDLPRPLQAVTGALVGAGGLVTAFGSLSGLLSGAGAAGAGLLGLLGSAGLVGLLLGGGGLVVALGSTSDAFGGLTDRVIETLDVFRRRLVGSSGSGGLLGTVTDAVSSAQEWLRRNGPGLIKRGFDALLDAAIAAVQDFQTILIGPSGQSGVLTAMVDAGTTWIRDTAPRLFGAAMEAIGEGIRQGIIDLTNPLRGRNSVFWDLLADASTWTINNVPSLFIAVGQGIVDALIRGVQGLFDGLVGNSTLKDQIRRAGNWLIENMGEVLGNVGGAIVGRIVSQIEALGGQIKQALTEELRAASNEAERALEGLSQTGQDIGRGLDGLQTEIRAESQEPLVMGQVTRAPPRETRVELRTEEIVQEQRRTREQLERLEIDLNQTVQSRDQGRFETFNG